ncbi:DUF418 domain-containing protein [Jeotgalibacillus haloalkalitolerans]|uniref:DUF418 domain-containing protein n=1 Tax=Jeotgalibacillus haloalkalitolerans TaxID=3104292 RepID=A0ABU5KQQ8_9BACL|nr:DUF418 domain-containing protein [Jeotgalibacillus sp. HH7-29]MDZ5713040.1 DUF418 domain-containing protein [Jeotgalibacillus sp. HH7-29]
MSLQPIGSQQRMQNLDVIRGFSLLGIFIVNMISFHSPFYYYDPYAWWGDSINRPVYWWIDVFVQASFYPIFAMMFGAGLAIQFMRASEKGTVFTSFAVRRLIILLGIGMIHAFLVWSGDILITYAVTGFILIWMLKLSGKMLLILGFTVYLLPQGLLTGIMFFASMVDPMTVTYFSSVQDIESSVANYGNGTFTQIFGQRLDDWEYANSPEGFVSIIIVILPLMMIGAGAAKLKLFQRAAEKKKLLGMLTVVFLGIGIALKTAPYWGEQNLAYVFMQDYVGGPLVGMGYMTLLLLIMTAAVSVKLLQPLAKTGRMALTTYLTQSVIGTLIFYNYGFGLYGEVTLMTGTLIALGIFVMQVIFAEIWLSKFNQGPVEKLWRKLSYSRK